MTPPLPGFFPGNKVLLAHAQVLASDEGLAAIRDALNQDLNMMHQPDHIWTSNIRHRYGADPLVMSLLDKYEALAARYGVTQTPAPPASSSKELHPWPTV